MSTAATRRRFIERPSNAAQQFTRKGNDMHSKSHATPTSETESKATVDSLNDLLAMAEHYGSVGSLRQAEDIFWMLAEEHSEEPQAEVARGKLRALAHEYERDGRAHEARAIYERLMEPRAGQ